MLKGHARFTNGGKVHGTSDLLEWNLTAGWWPTAGERMRRCLAWTFVSENKILAASHPIIVRLIGVMYALIAGFTLICAQYWHGSSIVSVDYASRPATVDKSTPAAATSLYLPHCSQSVTDLTWKCRILKILKNSLLIKPADHMMSFLDSFVVLTYSRQLFGFCQFSVMIIIY
jgi:hypothetical protein